MIESSQRVQEFKADVADLHIADPATGRERLFLKVGIGLMTLGPVLSIVAYTISHTGQALQQRDAIVLALIGIAVTVAGASIFLRYSIAAFLRFWLARLIYEQKAQTDRLLGTAVPATPEPNVVQIAEVDLTTT